VLTTGRHSVTLASTLSPGQNFFPFSATALVAPAPPPPNVRSQVGDFSCSNDFTLYDHVLDASVLFNVIPDKYAKAGLSELDLTFAMGRGRQRDGVDVEAQEMKKWFDR
jgi:Cobalamin-independent synthase, N-terminal domain